MAALRAIEFRMAGDLPRAAEEGRRAVALEPEASPGAWGAVTYVVLAGSLYWLGETAEARALLEEVVRSCQFDNRHFSVIWALGHLAVISGDEEDLHRADELARRALALADEHGFVEHYAAAMAHIALGRILERRGELGSAERSLLRGLELSRQFRAPAQMAYSLLAIARIRGAQGDHEGARPYLREARAIIRRCADLGIIDQLRAEVERELNRVGPRPLARADLVEKLTDRERSILRLLRSDLTQRQIASEIYVSFNTMKTHTRSLYRKLGASSRREAVDRARELGLFNNRGPNCPPVPHDKTNRG